MARRRRANRPQGDGVMPEHLAAGPRIDVWTDPDERPPARLGVTLEQWRAMAARSRWWDEFRRWCAQNDRDVWQARAEVRCTTPYRAQMLAEAEARGSETVEL